MYSCVHECRYHWYVCMHALMYTYIHVCMYECRYYWYACIHVLNVSMRVHVHTCTYHTFVFFCVCACMYVCMYVYIYIYIHTYIPAYIYIYIHTYRYIHVHTERERNADRFLFDSSPFLEQHFIHMQVNVYMQKYTFIHKHLHKHTHRDLRSYTYFACIHTHVWTYTRVDAVAAAGKALESVALRDESTVKRLLPTVQVSVLCCSCLYVYM